MSYGFQIHTITQHQYKRIGVINCMCNCSPIDPTLGISILAVALMFQKDSKVCILKLVMLVKLAIVMQKLKKYLKNFSHDQQRWGGQFLDLGGDTAVMRGDTELMGVPPVPPTRENPAVPNESFGFVYIDGTMLLLTESAVHT